MSSSFSDANSLRYLSIYFTDQNFYLSFMHNYFKFSPASINLKKNLDAEWATTNSCKLSARTCTTYKTMLGCKSCQAPWFQLHCFCPGEIWWMCQRRTSTYSPLRTRQQKCYSWTLNRLRILKLLIFISPCTFMTWWTSRGRKLD